MSSTPRPWVSIVTPTYRMAEFLTQTLRSVHYQDYPHIEHIVVDGGDDEETPKLIERHRDQIAVYLREPDRGQSHAINKGLARARGEIVAWLNADDCLFPGAVSRAVDILQTHPEVDLVYGHAVFIDRDGQFLRYFTEVEPHDPDRLRTAADYICQPTTFFRRAVFERLGGLNENLHYAMDWDLWCRMARAGCGFHMEPTLLAANREYPEAKTQSGGWARLREIIRVNLAHKTRLLPRASMTFAYHQLGSWSPPVATALAPLRRLKRIVDGQRDIPALYGLYHHSTAARHEVTISLPLLGPPPQRVALLARSPADLPTQNLELSVNGIQLGTTTLSPLPPSAPSVFTLGDQPFGNRIDVRLTAQAPHSCRGSEICFHLEGIRLTYPLSSPSVVTTRRDCARAQDSDVAADGPEPATDS